MTISAKLKPFVPLVLAVILGPVFMGLVDAVIGYKAEGSGMALALHDAASVLKGAAILAGMQYAYRKLPKIRKLLGEI